MQIDMILHSIDQGQLALPEFQRGYVWNRDHAILDLAWPDGLQEGLSRPVTVLLDEGKDSPPPPSLPCRDQSPTQSVAQGSAEQRALVSLDQS